MSGLNLNDMLDFVLWVRQDFKTRPLEEIFRPEHLAQLRAEGYSDEDIRRVLVPPVAEEFHED
jgi:hypothetical protein